MSGEAGLVEFRTSSIHGQGGFATRSVAVGTRVLEYLGERIDKRESCDRCAAGNPFIFALDEHWDLDGNMDANPARWINHSCAANCEVEFHDGRLWIVARRAIAAGDEVTFNYGYDLTEYREHPCHCGAAECVGFIVAEELFEHLRRGRAWCVSSSAAPLTRRPSPHPESIASVARMRPRAVPSP